MKRIEIYKKGDIRMKPLDLSSGKLETEDGICARNNDAWFSIRESNTELLIRLNVEAKDKKRMEEIADTLDSEITKLGGKIK